MLHGPTTRGSRAWFFGAKSNGSDFLISEKPNRICNFGGSMAQACATVKGSLFDIVEVKAYYRLA
jgi:hypothetical protein